LIWAAEHLAAQGHDVEVIRPRQRKLELVTRGNEVLNVRWRIPKPDVMVFQRITSPRLANAIPVLRRQGIAVVVDVDDDLTSLHPRNPVYASLHPNSGTVHTNGEKHSWTCLTDACRAATMVTVSTPGLLPVYAAHGRGRVLRNVLPEHYFGLSREDNDTVGWPAALVSHPDDPSACGGAIARLVGDGADFRVLGDPSGCGSAFGLRRDPAGLGPRAIELFDWPAQVARLGIGIRLHKLGVGLLAGRARSWYSQLSLLRNDEKARQQLSDQGREAVDGLRVVEESWRWAECWADALKIQRG
jgi:hypothetical protein